MRKMENLTAEPRTTHTEATDQFPEEPGVTDIAFVVEGKKLYTVKSVLALASPVFKSLFFSDFKEKNATEIELPGKKYEPFKNFLMCLSPNEYLDLKDDVIEDILPLANEYQVISMIKTCEAWLLKEIDLKKAKKRTMICDLEFLLKFYYYSGEYDLPNLRKRTLACLVPFTLSSCKQIEKYYGRLTDKDKLELFEARIEKLDSLHSGSTTCHSKHSHFLQHASTTGVKTINGPPGIMSGGLYLSSTTPRH
ncbi:kelch-like protein 40a [Saccostrea cucullata]|uniref:kelch-like protein 40a n=1 Tax=Saccostrea cuccullata TaxID=36930 RepID=UPI002ED4002A